MSSHCPHHPMHLASPFSRVSTNHPFSAPCLIILTFPPELPCSAPICLEQPYPCPLPALADFSLTFDLQLSYIKFLISLELARSPCYMCVLPENLMVPLARVPFEKLI